LQLKGLRLSNIRSYGSGETSVELRPGLTLFEGDIGSGKSTILAAIEFGLFGLGDVEAKHLLRHGAKRGKVEVTFEAGGREYTVSRTLSKSGRGIQQEECRLEGEGVSGAYSPSELKPKVLEILGFNEKPDAKSTSRIFRYAVYTPQESMKEVLSMGEGQRLDTLRRAFGIERYSWAVANAEDAVVREWLNRRLDALQEAMAELPKKRSELEAESRSLAGLEKEVGKLSKSEGEAAKACQALEEKIAELEPKKLSVAKLRSEIPLLERDLRESGVRLAQLGEEEKTSEREAKEASEASASLEAIRPEHEEYLKLRERLLELQPAAEDQNELTKEEGRLKGRIEVERRVIEKEATALEDEASNLKGLTEGTSAADVKLRSLQERKGELEAQAEALQGVEASLKEAERELTTLEAERASLEKEIRKAEDEWAKIELIGVGAPCPLCKEKLTQEHYEEVRADYSSRLSTLEASLGQLTTRLDAARSAVEGEEKGLAALQSAKAEASEVEIEMVRAEEELKDLGERASQAERASSQLIERRRLLADGGFASAERKALQDVQARLDALRPTVEEYDAARKRLAELERRQLPSSFARLSVMASKKEELEARLAKVKTEGEEVAKRQAGKEEVLKAKAAQLSREEPSLEELEEAQGRLREAEAELGDASKRLAAAMATVREATTRAEGLDQEVRGLEAKEREYLTADQTKKWLRELFVPSVSAIEKQVLASINETFNLRFQEWFSELMEAGDISVRIDESFSPVVEEEGYEIDSASLSGGERTSLALAYRLALNTMVKAQSSSEGGLLILDEPTDGFSSGQLLRLRDVLQETGCEQIIMVSHEKELESFVDNIYEVSRAEGESVVKEISR
jgi:exonuclease SbcC